MFHIDLVLKQITNQIYLLKACIKLHETKGTLYKPGILQLCCFQLLMNSVETLEVWYKRGVMNSAAKHQYIV